MIPKTHSDYVLEWARRGDRIAELQNLCDKQARELRDWKKVAICMTVSWVGLAIINILS